MSKNSHRLSKATVAMMILFFPCCMVNARLERIKQASSGKEKKAFLLLQAQKSKQCCVFQNLEILRGCKQQSNKEQLFVFSDFFSDAISEIQSKDIFRYSDLPPPTFT